jgi:hypothetical protein
VDQLTLPFTDRDLITDRELVEDDHPQLLFASVGASGL